MVAVMRLLARIRHRLGYVWYWRARHWWLDTRGGRIAQLAAQATLGLALTFGLARGVSAALASLPPAAGGWMIAVLSAALLATVVHIARRHARRARGDASW